MGFDRIRKHAEQAIEKLNLKNFTETSAKTGDHVEEVFETAVSLVRMF